MMATGSLQQAPELEVPEDPDDSVRSALRWAWDVESAACCLQETEPQDPYPTAGSLRFWRGNQRQTTAFGLRNTLAPFQDAVERLLEQRNGCEGFYVSDLHHMLRRTPSPMHCRPRENVRDGEFVRLWNGLTGSSFMELAEEHYQTPAQAGHDMWSRLRPAAKLFYARCWVPMLQAYAARENRPLIIQQDKRPVHVWSCYDFGATSTGRLVARGGRLSTEAQLFDHQTLPKTQRAATLPARKGCVLLHADYSAAELRVICALAEDRELDAVFAANGDPYTLVAQHAQELLRAMPSAPDVAINRGHAKVGTLQALYGSGLRTIAARASLPQEAARALVDAAHALFPTSFAFMESLSRQALADGGLWTVFGRWIPLPADEREHARRKMPNNLVQSTMAVANCLTFASLLRRCTASNPLIHIHDGYVVETPESLADIEAEFMRAVCEENPLADFGIKLRLRVSVQTAGCWT